MSDKRSRGRPTKLTPALIKAIAKYVGAGNYVEAAAAIHGISKQSVYNWLRAGARAEEMLEKGKGKVQAASTQTEGRTGWRLACFHFPKEEDLPL